MKQTISTGQKQKHKQKTRQKLKNPHMRNRSELISIVQELFLEEDVPDEDESPDDEDYPWMHDHEVFSEVKELSLEQLDFNARMHPQACQIILEASGRIRFLNNLFSSVYAQDIGNDLNAWYVMNKTDKENIVVPSEQIPIHPVQDNKKYRELTKNCRDVKVLLPNLAVVKLIGIYKFKRTQNLEKQQDAIINGLSEVYRQYELYGDFSNISAYYEKKVLSIKGVKGHTGNFSLFLSSIRSFFFLIYEVRRDKLSIGQFRELYLQQGSKKDKDFFEAYGELLWNKLRIQ